LTGVVVISKRKPLFILEGMGLYEVFKYQKFDFHLRIEGGSYCVLARTMGKSGAHG
jgi:hypothetical protein